MTFGRSQSPASRPFDALVFLAPFPWGEVWQSSHYLARHCAQRVPVLYVEPGPEWNPSAGHLVPRQLVRMLGPQRLREAEPCLHLLTPRSLPFGRFHRLRHASARLYAADVLAACRRVGFKRPLYWVFDDRFDRIQLLNPSTYVYHVLDLYPETPQEGQVIANAALIFTVSAALQERYDQRHRRCHLLSNGVEIEWFHPIQPGSRVRPSDVPISASRVLGYTGTISRHTDLVLLLAVSRAFPEVMVVVVGPVAKGLHGPQGVHKQALRALEQMPNALFLGPRPVWTLPEYVGLFDVCLVAAIPGDWTSHSDPLKFYQYLAMGKPVVSTRKIDRVPAELYYPAESETSFIEQTRNAMNETPRSENIRRRYLMAASRSWSSVVDHALEALAGAGCTLSASPDGSSP